MTRFLREYLPEIFILLIIPVGIFLLVEEINISDLVSNTVVNVQAFLQTSPMEAKNRVVDFFATISPSNILGWSLIVVANIFLLWRIRDRYLKSEHWRGTTCPVCSGQIKRIHRSTTDRILGKTLLPGARRYQCMNPGCKWNGLRKYGRRRKYHQETKDLLDYS